MRKKEVIDKIIFRADGNSNIGLGHIYRLLALIEIFKNKYKCIFLTKESSTISVIPKYTNLVLIPEGINISEESDWLSQKFHPEEYCIVVDGYQFDLQYQKGLKKEGFSLMFVDDYANEEVVADIIVNHSLAVSKTDYHSLPVHARLALGSKYAILRPLFLEQAKQSKTVKPIESVFLCFGGADFNNITLRCLKGIIPIKSVKEIHVVLGGAFEQKEIFMLIEGNKARVRLHQKLNESEMVNLMNKCDLAVIPSSTISYEVCSVKMIALCGYYIDNQIKIYQGLKKNGLIYPAGDFNKMNEKDFESSIRFIMNDKFENHQKILNNQKRFFDGKQNERFLNLLKEFLC